MTAPRFVTYLGEDKSIRMGLVEGDEVIDLTQRTKSETSLQDIVVASAFPKFAQFSGSKPDARLADVQLLPPILRPEKIICVGVNYPDRNAEYKDGEQAPKYPSLFMRTPRSFVGHRSPLVRPRASQQLDYEGELALVIGKAGRHISESDALGHIAALTICNEGTIRDWVRHAKFNVTQGKNFDSTGSMGPWIVPFLDEGQIADVKLTTKVNGDIRQDDRTSRMIFGFRYLIHYISTFTTLIPGDIIVTGTPTGAGARLDPPQFLKPGDRVEVTVDGLGTLSNSIVDE